MKLKLFPDIFSTISEGISITEVYSGMSTVDLDTGNHDLEGFIDIAPSYKQAGL